MAHPAELSGLEKFFQALADRTRLRLLNILHGREVCVCFFVEALRMSQPKISRHLAYLRGAGLVQARRQGKWMHYSLAELPPQQQRILTATLAALSSDPGPVRDLERLAKACCSPQLMKVMGAPVPTPSPRRKRQ